MYQMLVYKMVFCFLFGFYFIFVKERIWNFLFLKILEEFIIKFSINLILMVQELIF
jgi:hypothetical protein